MNERGKELLSAFLDDALADEELAELAQLWRTHPELGGEGVRYLQLGELLRASAGASVAAGAAQLLARVQTAVMDEPAPALEPMATPSAGAAVTALPARVRRWWPRPVTGLALVAGIALVAVGTLRLLVSETPGPLTGAPLAVVEAGAAAQRPGASTSAPGTPATGTAMLATEDGAAARGAPVASAGQHGAFRWSVSEPNVERRLNMYLVNHSEVTRSGTHGMLPYARVVGYRAAAPAQRR